MSEDDSGSEDLDYQPTKKEIKEAEGEERRSKRQKFGQDSGTSLPTAGKGSSKVDEIWQKLKVPGRGESAATGLNIAALCPTRSSEGVSNADKMLGAEAYEALKGTGKEWMRQLGVRSRPRPNPAPDKASEPQKKVQEAQASAKPSQIEQNPQTPKPSSTAIAAAALAAAKAAMSRTGPSSHGQVPVLETRRFAGKDVQIRKVATSEEAEELQRKEKERKKAGLDAVLASLETAKKVNVLDKSRDDWGNFKSKDSQIEDELEAYKRSGGKYLDKVDFLKRAELREYEAERDQRLAGDARSRGRL